MNKVHFSHDEGSSATALTKSGLLLGTSADEDENGEFTVFQKLDLPTKDGDWKPIATLPTFGDAIKFLETAK